MRKRKIHLLIVDDYPIVSEGLVSFLKNNKEINIIDVVPTQNKALELSKVLHPDIILSDFNNIDSCKNFFTNILNQEPVAPRLLTIGIRNDKETMMKILENKIDGYVFIDTPKEEIITAIRAIYGGGTYFSKGMSNLFTNVTDVNKTYNELTPREKEILLAVAIGKTNKDIAHDLHISIRTVETHRNKVRSKLALRSSTDFAFYVMENKLLPETAVR